MNEREQLKKLFETALNPTEAQSEKMLRELLIKPGNGSNERNIYMKRKPLKLVAIAAMLVIVLSISALAAVGFTTYENPAAMLRAFFGESYEDHSDGRVEYDEKGSLTICLPGWERVPVDETLADGLISKYISAETATILWDNYTLTVEANLYDSRTESGLLYYTIENPDGITGYEVRDKGSILFREEAISFYPGLSNSWTGQSYIDETRSTDTKIYICEYYTGFKGLSEDLGDLEIQVWSYTANKSIGSAKLDRANESNMPGLSLAGGNVLVSPISIRVYYEKLGFKSANDVHSIILRYNNGAEYVLLDETAFTDNSMYGLLDGVSSPSRIIYLFNRLVDVNNLSEIVLNGMALQVN